ncbi:MAG: LD-carboxypeptidase [Firmicutes bacterium]|nr:LD-carboxypeptidase [Bacillota bacterium]
MGKDHVTFERHVRPERLRPGDTIGIIAPASPTSRDELARALAIFSTFGYPVRLGRSVHEHVGYLSGSDAVRAYDIHTMFGDDEVKAIVCLRGGYGTLRLLNLLDYSFIARHPKIFVGYSDITALHVAFSQRANLLTFHGPMVANLAARQPDMQSWHILFDLLSDPATFPTYSGDTPRSGDGACSFTIHEGSAQGALTGGNLSLLVSTLGTPYEVDTRDKILLIEDVDEQPYRIDRMLTQLLHAGKLHAARGILCTDFKRSETSPQQGWRIADVLSDRLSSVPIPAFYGLPVGHCFPNFTLPIGGLIHMDATARQVNFLQSCVD